MLSSLSCAFPTISKPGTGKLRRRYFTNVLRSSLLWEAHWINFLEAKWFCTDVKWKGKCSIYQNDPRTFVSDLKNEAPWTCSFWFAYLQKKCPPKNIMHTRSKRVNRLELSDVIHYSTDIVFVLRSQVHLTSLKVFIAAMSHVSCLVKK